MEIGGRYGNIAQARHSKDIAIGFILGRIKATIVGLGHVASIGKIVPDDAKFLEHVAPDVHPLVAANAAIGFEQPIARLLRR